MLVVWRKLYCLRFSEEIYKLLLVFCLSILLCEVVLEEEGNFLVLFILLLIVVMLLLLLMLFFMDDLFCVLFLLVIFFNFLVCSCLRYDVMLVEIECVVLVMRYWFKIKIMKISLVINFKFMECNGNYIVLVKSLWVFKKFWYVGYLIFKGNKKYF